MTKQPKPPTASSLIKSIRDLAEKQQVAWTDHAFDERADERGIRPIDAMAVLRRGDIIGEIKRGRKPGEWRCLVQGPINWSKREIGVVTVVMLGRKLLVVTVEWIDP